jgi:uncharacterized membrane protein
LISQQPKERRDVLAVVIWIGGVAMATTVMLPAIRRGNLGADRLKAFEAIKRRSRQGTPAMGGEVGRSH